MQFRLIYCLGVVVIDICLRTRNRNGGIIPISEVLTTINSGRIKKNRIQSDISVDDIIRAVEKLSILGNEFKILKLMKTVLIVSVPIELNRDHEGIFGVILDNGYVSEKIMRIQYNWSVERFNIAVYSLMQDGILWVDNFEGMLNLIAV